MQRPAERPQWDNLPCMQLDTLRQALDAHGASPSHAARVLRLWALALPQTHGKRAIENFLPASLRAALPSIEAQLDGIARLGSVHPAADGSERLLVELADGQTVESVLLPRDGLCISSQVGCAVGCQFCMTGREGLIRQLGSAEMVAQVALARRRRAVKKVVSRVMPPKNQLPPLDVSECGIVDQLLGATTRPSTCITGYRRTLSEPHEH